MVDHRIAERTRWERRVWWAGLLIAILVHAAAVGLFRVPASRSPESGAAGPRRGDARAAPPGDGLRVVLPAPPTDISVPRPPVVAEPLPAPVPDGPVEEPQIVLADPGDPVPDGANGIPGSEGEGDAGDEATGAPRLVPPSPRGVILAPLDRPRRARGHEVTVWVLVNADGAVDSVRLESPTPDRGYNEALIRNAREWSFDPAERSGRPVSAWWSYTWKL